MEKNSSKQLKVRNNPLFKCEHYFFQKKKRTALECTHSWIPNEKQSGKHSVIVEVTDSNATITQTYSITVNPYYIPAKTLTNGGILLSGIIIISIILIIILIKKF
jgi:hypothetical protein